MNNEITLSDLNKNMSEIQQSLKEVAIRFKDTDERFKETDRQIKKAIGLFETQWGKLMESLVEGDLVRILQERGIAIRDTSSRRKGTYEGKQYEFDIIAHNGKEIVVVEVKTTLRVKHVKEHIDRLKQVKLWLKEYSRYKIYGAVAFLRAEEEADIYAQNQNLFVIRATGDSASILNPQEFKPRIF